MSTLPAALHPHLVRGADLPPLVWHLGYYDTPTEPYRPEMFQAPCVVAENALKPSGGWWSFPVLLSGAGGRPLKTSWSAYCDGMAWGRRWLADHGPEVQRLAPAPDAVVYRIDSREALEALAATFPSVFPPSHPYAKFLHLVRRHIPQVDWAVMAAAGIDAVQLTADGIRTARFATPGGDGPALETWDVETVFWLHPRFVVDENVATVLVAGKSDQVCTCTHWRSEHPAGPCSKADGYGCACECPSFELDCGWPPRV